MEEVPFYLKGTGPNLITEDELKVFNDSNPDLAKKLETHDIELRTLDLSYLESFVYWILSQQISGRVAELLINRFKGLFTKITPKAIINTDASLLREIGLSRRKIEYVYNIAQFFQYDENILDHKKYNSMQILDHYTQIKGIGSWTVNMFLIFNLGRLNIAAPKDLVVRKGMRVLYELDDVPDEKQAKQLMKSWGDYATIGTILSWAAMGE